MVKEIPSLPEPLTPEQEARISQLTDKQIEAIDEALLVNTSEVFNKTAAIIGHAMKKLDQRIIGIPETYYLIRLKKLVEKGLLESVGKIDYMRFSEVRFLSVASIINKK
ncbi:MAG: DUF3658 domain-containing protein [Pyrinomonadaceae bacterium]